MRPARSCARHGPARARARRRRRSACRRRRARLPPRRRRRPRRRPSEPPPVPSARKGSPARPLPNHRGEMDEGSITPRTPSAPAGRLTVGSLMGVAPGTGISPGGSAAARAAPPPPVPVAPVLRTVPPAGLLPPEEEGQNWSIVEGEVGHGGGQARFRSDGVEALTYNNPFGQLFERVWFDGRIVFALEAGEVEVDPDRVKVAQEYQIVYAVELDERGKLRRPPERVPGQYNIY